MEPIPWWVEDSYETFNDTAALLSEWEKIGDVNYEAYSKPIAIHYPPRVHVFFVVDALRDGGWVELNGIHYSPTLADNAARKRAYSDGIPHRVRIVVSYE